MKLRSILALAGAALASLVLFTSTVAAQGYPAPIGNIVATAVCPDYPSGVATVYAAVQDANGHGLSGVAVTFTLSAQASGDTGFYFASIGSNASRSLSGYTDGSGTATVLLQVGSASGAYTVRAVSGQRSAQVSCYVAAGKSDEPGVILPNTGTGVDQSMAVGARIFVAGFAFVALGVAGWLLLWHRSRTLRR